MLDVEEVAGLGSVDDLVEGVGLGGGRVGVEGDVLGGEEVAVGYVLLTAGFVPYVLVGGAALLRIRRWGGGGGVVVVVLSEGWYGLRLGSDGEEMGWFGLDKIKWGGFGVGVEGERRGGGLQLEQR